MTEKKNKFTFRKWKPLAKSLFWFSRKIRTVTRIKKAAGNKIMKEEGDTSRYNLEVRSMENV